MIESELILHLERLEPDPLDHWCVAVSSILSTVMLCCGLDSVTKVGSAQSSPDFWKKSRNWCVSVGGASA